MTSKKQRTICYFELLKKNISDGLEAPFIDLKEIMTDANSWEYADKVYEAEGRSVYLSTLRDEDNCQLGYVVTLKTNYRPDVVNGNTGEKRDNPKNSDEGDEEKTHFAIKYSSGCVTLVVENNSKGIAPKKLPVYFNFLFKKLHANASFNLKFVPIAIENFNDVLDRMHRAKTVEIFCNKAILGSSYFRMSNRLTPVKREIKITVSSERSQDIKEFSEDAYEAYTRNNGLVEKITITGIDDTDSPVKIDTSFAEKKSYIWVEVNREKGDLNTTNVFQQLEELIRGC